MIINDSITIGLSVIWLTAAKQKHPGCPPSAPPPSKIDWPSILAQYIFAENNVFLFPANQTVSNPIKSAEDTLQIIRPQTGGSELGGGGWGGREGCGGNDLKLQRKMEIVFAHVGVLECVESIRRREGKKKEVHNKQSRGELEERKGRTIEYAYACRRKSLHCSLAAEVVQLARG